MAKSKSVSETEFGADLTPVPNSGPAVKKERKKRTPKVLPPAWFKASFSDGTYRLIEARNQHEVSAKIVTVTVATTADIFAAGADGVTLEPMQ